MITLNRKPVKISTDLMELTALNSYLVHYIENPNLIDSIADLSAKSFYKWHINELGARVINTLLKHNFERHNKKLTFKVYLPEQKTLSILFNRYPVNNSYLMIIENKLIHGLTLSYE